MAVLYKQFSWKMVFRAAKSTTRVTVMVFFIVVGSISFGRLLATSGAITELVDFATGLDVSPLLIVGFTQIVLLVLGCFMDPASIVMITAPIFFPMVKELGFDMLWFATISLLSVQLGLISPPFGLDVYTMKALSPPHITLGDSLQGLHALLRHGSPAVDHSVLRPGDIHLAAGHIRGQVMSGR